MINEAEAALTDLTMIEKIKAENKRAIPPSYVF